MRVAALQLGCSVPLLLLLFSLAGSAATLPGKLTQVDIARATIEGGNVRLAAAVARPNITFGVLGGSITTGHGASSYAQSWWPTFERLLRGHESFKAKGLRFVSGAVAGTNSNFAELCLDTLLPSDVDVVFIEFDINSAGMGKEGTTESYEALVRKIMRYPRAPAVVLMHVPADHQERFQDTIADTTNMLLPFYLMSALSLRDAYWHHGINDAWSHDHVHPGDLGCEIMATLAQHLVASYSFRPHLLLSELEPLRQDTIMAVDRADASVCSHSQALKAYENAAWVLTEEHDKWGLVTHTRDAPLDIAFKPATNEITFQVAYLESYDAQMGTATVVCLEGCTCEAQRIDAHVSGGHLSVENIVKWAVKSESGTCTARVTMVSGDKFKIIGIIASQHIPFNSKIEQLFKHFRAPSL